MYLISTSTESPKIIWIGPRSELERKRVKFEQAGCMESLPEFRTRQWIVSGFLGIQKMGISPPKDDETHEFHSKRAPRFQTTPEAEVGNPLWLVVLQKIPKPSTIGTIGCWFSRPNLLGDFCSPSQQSMWIYTYNTRGWVPKSCSSKILEILRDSTLSGLEMEVESSVQLGRAGTSLVQEVSASDLDETPQQNACFSRP